MKKEDMKNLYNSSCQGLNLSKEKRVCYSCGSVKTYTDRKNMKTGT